MNQHNTKSSQPTVLPKEAIPTINSMNTDTGIITETSQNILANPGTTTQHNNTKRTKKAKHKTVDTNNDNNNTNLILPNSIDEIIGDMVFQEPSISKKLGIDKPGIIEQSPSISMICQTQKEILDKIQNGIRPGWFIQCIGRRADGKQCTRNIKKGSEFCMGHTINAAYGRVDIPNTKMNQFNILSNTNNINNLCQNPDDFTNIQDEEIQSIVSDAEYDDYQEILNNPTTLKTTLDTQINNSTATIPNITTHTKDKTKQLQSTLTTKKNNNKKKTEAQDIKQVNNIEISILPTSAGIVEQSHKQDEPIAPKKRGRRRKLPIDPRFGNNDYIIMWPIICEGQRFLIDRYENIYSNEPAHPVFIGVREVSGRIDRQAPPKSC